MYSIAGFIAYSLDEAFHAGKFVICCFGAFLLIEIEELGKILAILETPAHMRRIRVSNNIF